MSSFQMQARHKTSGKIHEIWCMDDYFGKHIYGYIAPNGNALREDEFYREYEVENN